MIDLSNCWLEQISIRDRDLREMILRGSNLNRATLIDCDLRGMDLSGADLSYACLIRNDLRGADLRGADLSGADLKDCRLDDADLSDVRVDRNTCLVGATMDGTKTRGIPTEMMKKFRDPNEDWG